MSHSDSSEGIMLSNQDASNCCILKQLVEHSKRIQQAVEIFKQDRKEPEF